jgi:hypothetical protein
MGLSVQAPRRVHVLRETHLRAAGCYSWWKTEKLEQKPFQAEATVLASLRRMEELWSNYCLCYFRCTAMADYQEALALHRECILQVRVGIYIIQWSIR